MRDNGPVTQRELPLPPGKALVSVTDLKGRIVYCNKAFVAVSGYAEAELLGQPHLGRLARFAGLAGAMLSSGRAPLNSSMRHRRVASPGGRRG